MNNGMCVLIENSERGTTIPYLVLAEDLVCPTIDQKKLNEKIQQFLLGNFPDNFH